MKIIKNKHKFYNFESIPSDEELGKYYHERYYQENKGSYQEDYDSEELKYFYNKIELKAFYIENIFKGKNNKSLLDIGCGEGFALNYFKKNGWNVFGIDHSDYGIQKFNPHLMLIFKKISFEKYFAECIENKIKYDVVWLKHVLEHVRDPELILHSIEKILETGGVLCLEVPNDFSILQNYLFENRLVDKQYWVKYPDHLNYFSPESLRLLLSDCGFKSIKLISDFPIDMFLLNKYSNYINNETVGKEAHRARIKFENLIHTQKSLIDIIKYYEESMNLGLGREIICFAKK